MHIVSFQFLYSPIRRIVQFLPIKKSLEFLENSATKIIEERKMELNGSSPVSHAAKLKQCIFC